MCVADCGLVALIGIQLSVGKTVVIKFDVFLLVLWLIYFIFCSTGCLFYIFTKVVFICIIKNIISLDGPVNLVSPTILLNSNLVILNSVRTVYVYDMVKKNTLN